MLDVALAEVFRARSRTAWRALAVAGVLSVTMLFEGFRLGLERQMAAPAAGLPAPLVALQEGASHVVGLRSDLPQAARAGVEEIPGVSAAHPLVAVPVIFERAARSLAGTR